MPLLGSFPKQTTERLPVSIDYSQVAGTQPVSAMSPVIVVPAGMVKDSHSVQGTTLTIFVSGGTDGQTYRWVVITDLTVDAGLITVEDEFDVRVADVPDTP